MKITWHDGGREPRDPPNPDYPNGIDLNLTSHVLETSCRADLPYPARRCGYYLVECETCGKRTVVSTAGRPDDPRSVTIACKRAS